MKIKKLKHLLQLAELQQNRLAKITDILEDIDYVSPSAKAVIVTQMLDLATSVTYVVNSQLAADMSSKPMTQEVRHYTFSPDELDEELDEYYEDDEDNGEPHEGR